MIPVKYYLKISFGFAALFLIYHTSEIVGSNPVWMLIPLVLFIPIAHLVGRWLGVGGLAGFGMKRHPGYVKNIWFGYFTGITFYALSIIYALLQGEISFSGPFNWQQVLPLVAGMIFLTFWSSTSEDLLTRGFVFRFLNRGVSQKNVIWISALLYTLNHIWRIENSYTQWILLLLMGLTFAIPLAKTGSLWFTIGCHWGWNTVAIFKDHIGDSASLKVIDRTSDWVYIITMIAFLLYVYWGQKRAAISSIEPNNNFNSGVGENQ